MIIVTGGAGFIGSNLVAALEARGRHDIIVVDRLGTGDKWRNIAKRELADLVAPERLFGALDVLGQKVEMVFHLGAISSTTEQDADLVVETNFRLSLQLWHWCAVHRVRLVYASSAATYGLGTEGFVDDGSIDALSRLRPLNAYGWSKHLFDRRVARWQAVGGMLPPQWAGLKFFNVYGPNEYHKGDMRSVVAKLWPQVLAGEPARLFRSTDPALPHGGQTRDFVHVDDTVAVMLWLLDHPQVCGLFNVGTGRARSWRDLAEAVFAAAGLPPKIEYVDMPPALAGRYQNRTEASLAKLRAAGYDRPTRTLEKGITSYCREYLATDDPYR